MSFVASMSAPKAVSLGKSFAGKQLQSVTTRMAKLAVAPVARPLLVEAGQKGGKLKTCKAAAKRFRITGTGKVRRGPQMRAFVQPGRMSGGCVSGRALQGPIGVVRGGWGWNVMLWSHG
jgi:hypothetical protein